MTQQISNRQKNIGKNFMEYIILCGFAFLAGLIDAVVGGGGLIQLPALFAVFPKMQETVLLGTNKLVSATGTAVATYRYASRITIIWALTLPAMIVAFFSSMLGAYAVSLLDRAVVRFLVLILLIVVAGYVFTRQDFGTVSKPDSQIVTRRKIVIAMLAGMGIGFYDGLFGPGTGIFLMFLFIKIFDFDFLQASASSKVINLATNIAALLCFAVQDTVNYTLALPMVVFNILGAISGTHLAIHKGNRFVRVSFMIVVIALIGKIAWDAIEIYFRH